MKTYLALFALSCTLPACDGSYVEEDAQLEDGVDGKEDALKAGRFELFTGKDGKFYFHLLAGNGQKVLQSQGYTRKSSAEDGIETVRFNGQHADSFQLLQARDGQWYFNLLAGNWETIGTSELYSTKSNAQRGLSAVVKLVTPAKEGSAPTGARFQTFLGLDGKYYFHLRAGNGEIVLQSQSYTKKASATAGIDSVRANGTSASRFQLRDAADGQTYFVLTAANGQVIGLGETYASRSNAQRGLNDVVSLLSDSSAIQQ